jgi:hypothetical protein
MKLRLAPYLENIGESGFACLLTMIQGNLAALTLSHWLVASETGILGGAIAATTIIAAQLRRSWVISLTLGILTVAADAVVHRATFGTASVVEALITGVGAFVLSLAAGHAVRALAARRRNAAV